MSAMQRNKGKAFERFIARALRELYGDRVRRGWQARDGADAPDVEGTPFHVECKHHKRPSVHAAVRQALADRAKAKDTRPLLVVTRENRGRVVVSFLWEEWLAAERVRNRMEGHETAALFDSQSKTQNTEGADEG